MIQAETEGSVDRVAIVVPVLDEERYIAGCLVSLLEDPAARDADVLVIDGGSTDRTVAIVAALQAAYPRVRLIDNPARQQSAALNLGACMAGCDVTVLLRADAHAAYPKHFVGTCVAALRKNRATSVVVPMRAVGVSTLQRAIAALQNSRLGNGGSAHRCGGWAGLIDHGHHAAFDRAFFRRIGGYDETFSHNEDAEHDERARQAGGRIWMCPEAEITYYPRSGLGGLWRQYFAHGSGRARMLLKHRRWPRPRQIAAPAALTGTVCGLALTPINAWCALVPAAYGLLCVGWAAAAAMRARDPSLLAMAPAAAALHFGWAAGFMRTLFHAAWAKGAQATWQTRPADLAASESRQVFEPRR